MEHSFTLNDNRQHPAVGLGTYKVGFIPGSASGQNGVPSVRDDHDLPNILKVAIVEQGCRLLDCAAYYENEDRIGKALEGLVPREELFLVSKVWCNAIYEGPEAVRAQVEKSISDLKADYLDLCLIHWPVPGKHVEAFKCLDELRREGKIKSIGVSNYTIEDLQELQAETNITPAVNQIEVNPFLFREKTISFCREKGILVQAYRPLRNGKEMEHPLLKDLAQKYGCTVAQLMGKFLVQQGIVLLSKSVNLDRIKENLSLPTSPISEEDLAAMRGLTTPDALQAAAELYQKCTVRDTPLPESAARTEFTKE